MTWNWTPVSQAIYDHFIHQTKNHDKVFYVNVNASLY